MTSVAVPVQFSQTTEIFETTVYESVDDSEPQHIGDEDTEMTDVEAQEYQHEEEEGEQEYDDQEMYNAEVGSTIVEPPQSDAVQTHAPSTIEDDMEYLDEVDYEEEQEDPASKDSDVHLVHETASYKPDTTTAQTPPAVSSAEDHLHPQQFYSPAAARRIPAPVPRPATPLLSNLTATTTTADDEPQDDDWPICLYTPNGQEYMLFRADGDTEALFEDNWLKSQPLETLFSSIRQTLENELASITTSFAMDEIVLSVSDLEVSIAEDNCYTREISLQDLVNLINSLCTRNGTVRASTCKLYLSLQPRFIARFNQLVSLTSQSIETIQKSEPEAEDAEESEEASGEQQDHVDETEQVDDFHGEEEHVTEQVHDEAPEEEYDEYEGDENPEEAEYDEDETAGIQAENPEGEELNPENPEVVAADEVVDSETQAGELVEAEEDELYEENEESYNPALQSTETLVNEEDVGEEVVEEQQQEDDEEEVDLVQSFEEIVHEEVYEEQEEHQEYEEEVLHFEEDRQDDQGQSNPPVVVHPQESLDTSGQSEGEENDDDDLISYEEAVDQTEDGQDYRQQYLNNEHHQLQHEESTNGHVARNETLPLNGIANETLAEEPVSGTTSPTPKRPLDQVVDDPAAEDHAPPSKRAKS